MTEIVSEDTIRRDYWPYWHSRMVERYGEISNGDSYAWSDCLNDWITIHWAEDITATIAPKPLDK